MSNPPVIAEPFYEFDVTFVDESTATLYMICSNPTDTSDMDTLAPILYNAIKTTDSANVKMVTQNLWGEQVENSFTAAVEPPPPPEITYNPRH